MRLDDFEKDVFRLREFRILPGAVLVVVLHAQHDILFLGVLQRTPNAFDRAFDAVLAGQIGIALAAERATVTNAEQATEIDGGLLTLNLTAAFGRIGMGEVRRETQKRGNLPRLFERLADRSDAGFIEAGKEAVVMFDTLGAERGGLPQPFKIIATPRVQIIEVTLGKDADSRLRLAHGFVLAGFRCWCRKRPSHNLMVRSQLPAARAASFGATARHSTSPVCFNAARSRQVVVSHSLISPGLFQSPPPLTSVLSS